MVRAGGPLAVSAGWSHGVCPTHPGVRAELHKELGEQLDRNFLSGINLNFRALRVTLRHGTCGT